MEWFWHVCNVYCICIYGYIYFCERNKELLSFTFKKKSKHSFKIYTIMHIFPYDTIWKSKINNKNTRKHLFLFRSTEVVVPSLEIKIIHRSD